MLHFIVAIFILLLFIPLKATFLTGATSSNYRSLTERERAEDIRVQEFINPYENLNLEAKAIFVLDLEKEKVLFQKNASLKLPLASLTKLITAIVVEGTLKRVGQEARTVTFGEASIRQEGDDGFLIGETFYVADLRDVMLMRSSNDAAYALARWVEKNSRDHEEAFVSAMNRFTGQLGFSKMHFLNSTGLDVTDSRPGAEGSAREVALLFSWILRESGHIVFATQSSVIEVVSADGKRHVFHSRARPILNIPGLVGAKTGFTNLAGGNIVFAFNVGPQRPFVVSILGSSREGRFTDAYKLYEATKKYIQQ